MIKLVPLQEKHFPDLSKFLAENDWPFHSKADWSLERVESKWKSGYFSGTGKASYIISNEFGLHIGYLRIFDLGENKDDDETPLFDLRIAEEFRGRKFGKNTVDWLVENVFTQYPNKNRIEATTRHDNRAMRKVLENCGFAKEAHYRQAWPLKDGTKVDCVSYAILKSDWKSGESTIVQWLD